MDIRQLLAPLRSIHARARDALVDPCQHAVIVTDERGGRLAAPLNVEAEVAWAGYANGSIQSSVEPLLGAALVSRGLLRC